jgi:hypothetical protein
MNEDFLALLNTLVRRDVRFLVVGAYAVAVHGVPRATADMDVWIEPNAANAARAWAALLEFGAPLTNMKESDLAVDDTVYQIGVAPRRIDVQTSVTGVAFEQAWPRRVTVEISGTPVPFLGRDDLLANKRASGRPKDLFDIAYLERRGTKRK